MESRSPQRDQVIEIGLLVIVAAIAIGSGLGQATFWEPDEPRFAEASRQMFLRNDFITPYFNGVPRFEKPILLYWMQALAYALFGTSEFAARLPVALAGIGCVVLLYQLGQRLSSRTAALVAGLVLATMFRFVTFSREGLTDIPTLLFIVGALYGFQRASESPGIRGAALAAWACIGLGVLTKGPVGIVPLVIWLPYAAVSRQWRYISAIRPVPGALVATAIVLPWYTAMASIHGRDFIRFAIGHEVVSRYLSEGSFAPPRGPFYYLKVWPGDAAPWSALFVAAVLWSGRHWSRIEHNERRAIAFSLTWFVAVFVLFSSSQSKVAHYVLPCLPRRRPDDRNFHRPDIARAAARINLVACADSADDSGVDRCVAADREDADSRVRRHAGRGGMVAPMHARAGSRRSGHFHRDNTTGGSHQHDRRHARGHLWGDRGIIVPALVEPLKPMPVLGRKAAKVAKDRQAIGLFGRYGASSLIFYSEHDVKWLDDDRQVIAFLSRPEGAICVLPRTEFDALARHLNPAVRVVGSAQEFNVRIEHLMEGRSPDHKTWLLIVGPGAS